MKRAADLFHETRPAMGTSFDLWLYASDRWRAAELIEVAFEEIDRVESDLSTYRPTSELSRINSRAADAPVTTDPQTFRLIERSLEYSRASSGAFDITVGRLMRAWGFFRGAGRYPSGDEIARVVEQTGWERVELEPRKRTIRFQHPGIELDMGAIGKGYALDQAADLLRAHGVTAALIGAGHSTYYAIGAPSGRRGWRIDVPAPFDSSRTLSGVRLRDGGLSTSGNYERFFELEGTRYCHIMDPRTGAPVKGMVQVTALASRATDADALSTAIFVTGATRCAELLEGRPDSAALLVAGTAEETDVVTVDWPADVERGGGSHNRLSREEAAATRTERKRR